MFEQIMSVATRNALSNLSETSQVSVGGGASSIAPVGPAPTASFGDVLAQMTGSVSSKLAGAEANSIQSMTGDVAVRDVVNSVMEAEQSLQTAIAIRDKIVQAYLEISRMPI